MVRQIWDHILEVGSTGLDLRLDVAGKRKKKNQSCDLLVLLIRNSCTCLPIKIYVLPENLLSVTITKSKPVKISASVWQYLNYAMTEDSRTVYSSLNWSFKLLIFFFFCNLKSSSFSKDPSCLQNKDSCFIILLSHMRAIFYIIVLWMLKGLAGQVTYSTGRNRMARLISLQSTPNVFIHLLWNSGNNVSWRTSCLRLQSNSLSPELNYSDVSYTAQ